MIIGNSDNTEARMMDLGSSDGGEDSEHNCVGYVEISKIFVMQDECHYLTASTTVLWSACRINQFLSRPSRIKVRQFFLPFDRGIYLSYPVVSTHVSYMSLSHTNNLEIPTVILS